MVVAPESDRNSHGGREGMTCPDCAGEGKVVNDRYTEGPITCNFCNGIGVIADPPPTTDDLFREVREELRRFAFRKGA